MDLTNFFFFFKIPPFKGSKFKVSKPVSTSLSIIFVVSLWKLNPMGESASMVSIFWDTIKNFKTMVFRWCRWFSTNILWNSSKWKLSLSRTPAEFLSFDQKKSRKTVLITKVPIKIKFLKFKTLKKCRFRCQNHHQFSTFEKGSNNKKKRQNQNFLCLRRQNRI